MTGQVLGGDGAGGTGPDGLSETIETLWRHGEWDALIGIDHALIEAHSARVRVREALIVATAHQHLGDDAAALQWVARARAWGASDRQVARWLLGGVHNSLGRAASVMGQSTRAALHFQSAVGLGSSASVARTAWPARAATQCAQLGLAPAAEGAQPTAALPASRPHPLAQALDQIGRTADRLAQQQESLQSLEDRVAKQMTALRKSIESTVRREVANMARQVEAHADVIRHLDTDRMLPELHGWAISPDFARHLLARIEARDYDLVVEFGSGTSTVLVSLALQRDARRGRKGVPGLLSFEHDLAYFRQTTGQLQAAGVADVGRLVHARLCPWTADDGRSFRYYDCAEALGEAAARLNPSRQRLLVIVDGPPAATGSHARYPALPHLLAHFPRASFDLLVDDYKRGDEQEMVQWWLDDLERHGFVATATEIDLEKQGCLVRATPRGDGGGPRGPAR